MGLEHAPTPYDIHPGNYGLHFDMDLWSVSPHPSTGSSSTGLGTTDPAPCTVNSLLDISHVPPAGRSNFGLQRKIQMAATLPTPPQPNGQQSISGDDISRIPPAGRSTFSLQREIEKARRAGTLPSPPPPRPRPESQHSVSGEASEGFQERIDSEKLNRTVSDLSDAGEPGSSSGYKFSTSQPDSIPVPQPIESEDDIDAIRPVGPEADPPDDGNGESGEKGEDDAPTAEGKTSRRRWWSWKRLLSVLRACIRTKKGHVLKRKGGRRLDVAEQ
ncbi:hypothetical protein BCR34DRAFT_561838 [Clohesyomyces aquaticus]|uniref:Uncharacterized protein n=1 Tax=Clohesyomyces aquaticus TaxID=1231657 RepID=A0A1Y1ZTS9_9PLEO|nr:hypothetical protein BCR34DRAFT_561838 [Clohesyomyces aquaticus]